MRSIANRLSAAVAETVGIAVGQSGEVADDSRGLAESIAGGTDDFGQMAEIIQRIENRHPVSYNETDSTDTTASE